MKKRMITEHTMTWRGQSVVTRDHADVAYAVATLGSEVEVSSQPVALYRDKAAA